MNKIIYLIMSCLILFGCEVSGYREITLTGNRVLAKGDVAQGFNSIHINRKNEFSNTIYFTVDVTKGDTYSLEMSVDEALLPHLGYRINDNTLTIDFDAYYGYFGDYYYSYTEDEVEINVTITMPEIIEIWNDSHTTIDITSFDQFSELTIDGYNWDSSIMMAESVHITNHFSLNNKVEGLEVITCGSFESFGNDLISYDLTTLHASADIYITGYSNFPSLNSITGSHITLTDEYVTSSITSIQGESITLTGPINVSTMTADSISLNGVLTIDNLSATSLEIFSGEETVINSITADNISVTYEMNSNLSLPANTTINDLTIMANVGENIIYESIKVENLTIISNSNSFVTISDLETTNLTVVNSDSTVILPLNVTYETVDITLDDGIITMGGSCNTLEITMMENSYEKTAVDLSTLNANETEVIMGSFNTLILGTSNRIVYNLSSNTDLTYSGTPVSVIGLLGSNNITINGEEVR